MMKLLPEIFDEIHAAATKKEKIQVLTRYDHPYFRAWLIAAFDPKYKWDLPEGAPPFKTDRDLPIGFEGNTLYPQARTLYIYNSNYKGVPPQRKEVLFQMILEGVHWKEADFLIDLKDSKLAEKYGVTAALVKTAFPGIFDPVNAPRVVQIKQEA
jgi:hypothetical protein